MVSHKKMSGLDLSLGKGGLRFKKRASSYNVCIGKEMKGKSPVKGRYDKQFQAAFTAAAQRCAKSV